MTPNEPTPTTGPSTASQTTLYQQLRGHLATLKLHDAAEHLPAVLDAAHAKGLSLTAALERLLAIEVGRRQAIGGLELAHTLRELESLGQKVDQCRIDIIDRLPDGFELAECIVGCSGGVRHNQNFSDLNKCVP